MLPRATRGRKPSSGGSRTGPRTRPQAAGLRLRRAARRTWRILKSDKVAASHLLYFMISAALFIPLIGGMLYFMRDTSESQLDEAAGLEARARDVIEKMTLAPGRLHSLDWNGNPINQTEWPASRLADWHEYGPGLRVVDVGISRADNHRLVHAGKIQNLQQAGIEKDIDNAFLDYKEMHEALALDDRFDFALRMEPIRADLGVDPYGSRPIRDAKVAYVAALQDPPLYDVDHWANPTAQAQKEINALKALGMTAFGGNPVKGYYPQVCGQSPLKEGPVIGDVDTSIAGPGPGGCDSPVTKTYPEWFATSYLFETDGTARFDVVIFGSGVNLGKWGTSVPVRQNLTHFVEYGGTVVFLSNTGLPTNFITNCTSMELCLLYPRPEGTTVMTEHDPTHQLLRVPNPVMNAFVTADAPPGDNWVVCPDESNGFFPVYRVEATNCATLRLGFTTPERFSCLVGCNPPRVGGNVILAALDLAGADPDDLAGLFANIVSYSFLRSAYLDYGLELPFDRPIRAAARVMALELPNGEHLSVSLRLYLWRNY